MLLDSADALYFYGSFMVTKYRKVSIFMSNWMLYQQYHFAIFCSQGRNKFVIYDGDGISKLYEVIYIFPGKSGVYIC